MNLQELFGLMRDKDEGSDRPDIARFSPEEISSRDKDRRETFDAIGRRVLSKFRPPAMMVVRQSSKLAQKGIEKWAKSAKKKGMSETEIWRGAWDKFGQGVYYDDLDRTWKIEIATDKVKLDKKSASYHDTRKDTAQIGWRDKKLKDVVDWEGLEEKEPDIASRRVGSVTAGKGITEGGEFRPARGKGLGKIRSAEGPTQKAAMQSLMHETQHLFQDKYGMTGGANPKMFEIPRDAYDKGVEQLKSLLTAKMWLEYKQKFDIADGMETLGDWNDFEIAFKEKIGANEEPSQTHMLATQERYDEVKGASEFLRDTLQRSSDPMRSYLMQSGEAEARMTMYSHRMTPAQLRESMPSERYDIPYGDRYRVLAPNEYIQKLTDDLENPVRNWKSTKGKLKGAPAIKREAWKPPESKIFDLKGLDDRSRFPDVPQVAPERYEPPRGVPKDILPTTRKANMNRIAGLLEGGIEKGGLSWYNLRPLRDEYINVWGEAEGLDRFNKFTEIVAASSPRANVTANIKRASMFQKLQEDGVDISKVLNVGKTPTPQQFNEGYTVMPQGYGHLAHGIHTPVLEDIMAGKGLTGGKPFGRPKVSTFGPNLQGNLAGSTVDTHNKKALTLPLNLKEAVKDNEYGFLDEVNKKQAARHGIDPAQAQSSTWVGASDITGVDDARPFMQILNERVMETARKLNVDPAVARDMFIKGKTQLYNLLPLGKILKSFTPREPWQQVPKGAGYHTMRHGPRS